MVGYMRERFDWDIEMMADFHDEQFRDACFDFWCNNPKPLFDLTRGNK